MGILEEEEWNGRVKVICAQMGRIEWAGDWEKME
jgi:hypothetical protein